MLEISVPERYGRTSLNLIQLLKQNFVPISVRVDNVKMCFPTLRENKNSLIKT